MPVEKKPLKKANPLKLVGRLTNTSVLPKQTTQNKVLNGAS